MQDSLKLLSVLGYKFDLSYTSATALEEIEYVENWISERSKTVSLRELSALQVRRQVSKQGAKQWIVDKIPKVLHEVLFLKHIHDDFKALDGNKDS